MHLFSYIVARDYGFAPNPFNGICTLATCKPVIRHTAVIGDWVIGTGPSKLNMSGRLIFAMKVTDKLTFNEYWSDARYQVKKPHMNGGLKQAFGDNIYFRNEQTGEWHQENSHHSYADGLVNVHNLKRDTSYPDVLVSTHYYYFGQAHVVIPANLLPICVKTQGHKKNHAEQLVRSFLEWLESTYTPGYKANPIKFQSFERYDGVS